MAPFSRARPGRPLTVSVVARNTSSTPRPVIAVAKVVTAPDLQAATYAEIPANDERTIELRLRAPESARDYIELDVSLNDPENPGQVLLGPSGTPLIDQRKFSVSQEWLVTALAMHPPKAMLPEWYWPRDETDMEYEWVIATRSDSSQSRRTLPVDYFNLPTHVADWQGIDELVISIDRPFQDPIALDSINHWIASGGRAWVMLDQITPTNLRQLLSDGMSCEMLDDIELQRFTIDSTALNRLKAEDRTVESDIPMRFRRVTQTGGEVTLSIDGYPVAIWYRIGKGMILVTTLPPEGWVKPRTTSRIPGEEFTTSYQLHNWALSTADRMHEVKQIVSPIEAADVQYPLQQIGNPVLNRGYVLAIVGGFCGLLCAVSGICWMANRMLHLAWLIPLTSAIAAAPLVIASVNQRRDIPDTSSHLQLIEVQPGSRTIQALQWTASYMSRTDNIKLLGDADAMVSWPRSDNQLDLRRWTWLDHGKWELSSSGWPSGLWQMRSRYALPKAELDVLAHIDEQGLHVQLPAALDQPLGDAVVQFQFGNPEPSGTISGAGDFQVSERHLVQTDSWLTGSIVSDEQRRRETVYRQLQATGSQSGFPSYPAVMGWTTLWPSPIAWSEDRDQRGSALVVLPIKLLPTPVGKRVHVPHTVVHVSNANRNGTFSTAFSNSSGWWRGETTVPAKVTLRCVLPRQVCPIQADECTCHIQMRVPQRKVFLNAIMPNGEIKLIKEFLSPNAVQTVRIVDPLLLEDLRDGIIDLELDIGLEVTDTGSSFAEQRAIWQVDYVRLSVEGEVAAR